jgi:hypothetical protein
MDDNFVVLVPLRRRVYEIRRISSSSLSERGVQDHCF